MIKRILMAASVFAFVGGAAFGQVKEAIEDVIGNQLQAFNDRDVTEAFSYASPMIKGIFRDPANFGVMVEHGYPMVWDNADVQFLELREGNGVTLQRLTLKGAGGVLHTLEYAMIETSEGWQINGVQLVQLDQSA